MGDGRAPVAGPQQRLGLPGAGGVEPDQAGQRGELLGLLAAGVLAGVQADQVVELVAVRLTALQQLRVDQPLQQDLGGGLRLVQQPGRGRTAEVQFPLLVHPSRHGDPSARDLVRLMADETGPDAFIRQQQAIMGRADSRPGLGAIGCPTLVLVGDSDLLTPPELSAELADGIPGARLVVVAGSGHLTPLDQPEEVTKALVEWLQA